MTDYFANLNLALQSVATWLMTIVLVLLAGVTIIGFLLFISNRKFNRYMFVGFILFIVCSLIFTKIFGYRMEFFNASVSQISLYAVWYLWFLFSGVPTQPPPEGGSMLLVLMMIKLW
jgi:hypothetical protein